MATLSSTVDYSEHFDPVWYLSTYYGDIHEQAKGGDCMQFMMDGLHCYFQKGDITGTRLLDVGSGPCIHSILSASSHVKEIHLSEYTEANRKILSDWWTGERVLQPELIKYSLQKEKSMLSVEEKTKELREKVSAILSLNVKNANSLETESSNSYYDVITSSLCLEAAAETILEYKAIVSNVSKLLNQGGWFALVGVLEQTFYRVGSYNFRCLPIDADTLKSIYEQEGYQIVSFKKMKAQEGFDNTYSDFKFVFTMLARKA